MPKFNFELFKTLILNFQYIQSKRITLGMFILSQKYQFVYLNKVNSPPIRQFPSFSTFGQATCHVIIIKRYSTRKPQGLLLGKNSFCSRSPGERYCQSFICSEHTFDPGLKPLLRGERGPIVGCLSKLSFRSLSVVGKFLLLSRNAS